MFKEKITDKKIGIWGLGIVGQAALRFFRGQGAQCIVFDSKRNAFADLPHFLNNNDYILPSPGIDLRSYEAYQHKFLSEVDIFGQFFKKPIIAITGSVGKTTVTTLLAQIMETAGYRVAVGGNIGIGMLDLIADQETYDYAILELSSFQLALCKSFAPDLAIWTNFYPNHLDRHGTVDDYFAAKMNILREPRKALVGEDVWEKIRNNKKGMHPNPSIHSLSPSATTTTQDERDVDTLVKIMSPVRHRVRRSLGVVGGFSDGGNHTDTMPSITHLQNWQTIIQALELLNIPIPDLSKINFTLPEHRLEKVAIINDITFYNDSKATIAEATLAAVEQLNEKPIILLLGGLSKGVDRKPLIRQLAGRVKKIVAFGMEANIIQKLCDQEALDCASCSTLEDAVDTAMQKSVSGDQILLSPGGASFDLFENYQTRGQRFKELVKTFQ